MPGASPRPVVWWPRRSLDQARDPMGAEAMAARIIPGDIAPDPGYAEARSSRRAGPRAARLRPPPQSRLLSWAACEPAPHGSSPGPRLALREVRRRLDAEMVRRGIATSRSEAALAI